MIARPDAPVALTQGDPAGIGPELALKAWMRCEEVGHPFFVLTDPAFLQGVAERLNLTVPVEPCALGEVETVFARALPVVPIRTRVSAEPGRPDSSSAQGTLESIETAVRLAQHGAIPGLATNPIAKHVLYGAGFPHPGHTELLAALAAGTGGTPPHPVMMLWCEELAVVPVTVHIALRRVSEELTTELIVATGRIVARDLRLRFGVERPRLAFAGLNPHAGENATLGTEDRDVVAPAIEKLRREGVDARGPFPADTLFHRSARRTYDVAVAMYHDQALLPIKTIAFDEAVNVTLGLPFVRTSPDHGTAFDIAGQGIARPDSLIAAIRLAARLGRSASQDNA